MTTTQNFYVKICLVGMLMMVFAQTASAQYNYQNEPILNIIKDIGNQTSFRFLYRDALIADINLTFASNQEQIWQRFGDAISHYSLNIKVNKERNQAIIYQPKKKLETGQKVTIKGQIVDGTTGERLPYASIYWQVDGDAGGVSADKSGNFLIEQNFNQTPIQIRGSYIGYQPQTIGLDFVQSTNIHELTFRLQPKKIIGDELLVIGQNNLGSLSKQSANLVDIGVFSPMGESSTMRALQTLPSVSLSAAMSDGLSVRGSPTDGFRVLLDGITIFNQSHLFGMIDSFNADALKRSGFFYDVTPAKYQAAPGGTLLLLTKTGSLQHITGTAGLSNSAIRFTLEGPLKKGKSSWLIAARKSYMNTINWFNNTQLVRRGLNVKRNRSTLDPEFINLKSYLVKPGKARASFFDLHGKLYFERKNGDRLILSGYWGGDDTQLNAKRLFRSIAALGSGFEYQPVMSKNNWQNGAASMQFQHWFGSSNYSSTTAGFSVYQTSFLKDDFTYLQIDPLDQSLSAFIFPYQSESVLNLFKIKQEFNFFTDSWIWSGGLAYKYYLGEYLEKSFNHPGYFNRKNAHQLDLFAQGDYIGWDKLHFFTGLRIHYYSQGQYLRWSPRVKLTLFPKSKVSVEAGFSRNHQFINQISLRNAVTSNVWILSGQNQPPTSVNYYTAGAYFDVNDYLYAQVEGYYKSFKNVRLHELNSFSLSNTFNYNPWFSNNTGTGKGVELLVKAGVDAVAVTQTFSVSSITLQNPTINNGKTFYAGWDRRYNYTATLQTHPFDHLSLYLSWMFATGNPNSLAVFGPQQKIRMENYRRTDFSIKYNNTIGATGFVISASLFNIFNRPNPWYRDLNIAIDTKNTPNQFRGASAVVYDIGFQPSFNISVHF